MICITIAGNPIAAPRPRVRSMQMKDASSPTGFRSFSGAYNPAFYKQYRDIGKLLVMQAATSRCPLTGPVRVNVEIYVPIPTSMSAKKQRFAESKDLRPITRPDVDNYLKTALDLLTGIILRDDSLVVDSRIQKYYSYRPRMEIEVEEMAPDGRLF
jgi:Holliday junction resolvase RusA-like endonuclease